MRSRAIASPIFARLVPLFLCTMLLSCGGASGTVVSGFEAPPLDPSDGPTAGNPDGTYPVPPEAQAEDVTNPDHVIGSGTPESCTAEAFIAAVAQGGTIVFDGGPDPLTITLTEPAKVFNDQNPDVVIDGGGVVTLSGGGTTRILYMNTCDPDQHWTTSHCQDRDYPRLTVQNLTFSGGNSTNQTEYDGGAAICVLRQYHGLPVYIVGCMFGGAEGYGNYGSNGGAISSNGVSWTILNSFFSHNCAIGNGATRQSRAHRAAAAGPPSTTTETPRP